MSYRGNQAWQPPQGRSGYHNQQNGSYRGSFGGRNSTYHQGRNHYDGQQSSGYRSGQNNYKQGGEQYPQQQQQQQQQSRYQQHSQQHQQHLSNSPERDSYRQRQQRFQSPPQTQMQLHHHQQDNYGNHSKSTEISSFTNEGGDNRMGFQHKNHQQSHFGGREMQRNNYSSFYNRNNNSSQQRYSGDTRNQLWMGDIDPLWDEEAIMNIWKLVGFQPTNVKIMRDRNADKAYKGRSDYCFVSFPDPQAVSNAIQKNGTQIPDTQRVFKLNWTNQSNHQSGDPGMRNHNPNSQTGGGQFSKGGKPEFSLFVGDLGGDVTDELLYEAFEKAFPNQILQARVMYDPTTKQSKGFGFVKVTNQTIQSNAITEMSGFVINGRPIRVGQASGGANRGGPITSTSSTSSTASSKFNTIENDTITISQQYQPPLNQFTDPNNTTLVVKGLSSKVSEDELIAYFIAFGDIVLCKLSYDLNTGYVKFLTREAAENAILHMHGITICGCRLVVTWGIINPTTDEIIQPPEYQKCPPPPGVAGKLGPINMCFHKLTKEELSQLDFFRDNEPLTVPQSNKLYIARQSKVHTILDEALL